MIQKETDQQTKAGKEYFKYKKGYFRERIRVKSTKKVLDNIKYKMYKRSIRNVAQPGRVLRSGRRGQGFESLHSDQYQKAEEYTFAFFVVQFPCKALGQPTVKK